MGKWAGRMALATVQIAVAIGVSFTPLFDMDWGQSLPMVVLILLGWAASKRFRFICVSAALCFGSATRNLNRRSNNRVLKAFRT